jgi:hypothetical protein
MTFRRAQRVEMNDAAGRRIDGLGLSDMLAQGSASDRGSQAGRNRAPWQNVNRGLLSDHPVEAGVGAVHPFHSFPAAGVMATSGSELPR